MAKARDSGASGKPVRSTAGTGTGIGAAGTGAGAVVAGADTTAVASPVVGTNTAAGSEATAELPTTVASPSDTGDSMTVAANVVSAEGEAGDSASTDGACEVTGGSVGSTTGGGFSRRFEKSAINSATRCSTSRHPVPLPIATTGVWCFRIRYSSLSFASATFLWGDNG